LEAHFKHGLIGSRVYFKIYKY